MRGVYIVEDAAEEAEPVAGGQPEAAAAPDDDAVPEAAPPQPPTIHSPEEEAPQPPYETDTNMTEQELEKAKNSRSVSELMVGRCRTFHLCTFYGMLFLQAIKLISCPDASG